MDLAMPGELGTAYTSFSQKARAITEGWGKNELFCPNCSSDRLDPLPNNAKAADYSCPQCKVRTQLKGKAGKFGRRISDGEYKTFLGELRAGRTPDLLLVEYHRASWTVSGAVLVPRFALTESAIIARKPLSAKARRAGWQGCNISLDNVPQLARISLVADGVCRRTADVRADYARLRPLDETQRETRGWTLDVLRVVENFGAREFTNADVYAYAPALEQLHPGNRHVTDKIRQQLQVLRDLGLLIHAGRGCWRNVAPAAARW